MNKILVINTGSSSTKIALFEDNREIFTDEMSHKKEDLQQLSSIEDEITFRFNIIKNIIIEKNIKYSDLSAIGAIGGILKPLPGGVYQVNEVMVQDILHGKVQAKHASNLAAIISCRIAEKNSLRAFIVDPISTDELADIARISGIPEIERKSRTHALNVKACLRRAVKEFSFPNSGNFIVAHIGGGLTINLVSNGRIIDIEDGRQYGPFSTEAAGGVPVSDFIEYVFDNNISKNDAMKYWYGKGGVTAHLKTNSIKDSIDMAKSGDKHAEIVLDAMCYQIAKSIGALSVVISGKVDAIILTGGAARSDYITDRIIKYVTHIGKMIIYPGEEELQAISDSIILALNNRIEIKEYN